MSIITEFKVFDYTTCVCNYTLIQYLKYKLFNNTIYIIETFLVQYMRYKLFFTIYKIQQFNSTIYKV